MKLQHLLSAIGFSTALGWAAAYAQLVPPATDIAAQVRTQGYSCEGSPSAERINMQSRPDEPLWILTCSNATYRVRLVPDMKAQVERLR